VGVTVSFYENSINYNIYTLASSLFKGATQYYVAHFDVGQPEMRILSTLGSRGALPAFQLVALTAMDKALISRVLATLDRRGYVQAAPPHTDARRRMWELTPSGRDLVARLQPVWKKREAIIQADLSPKERKLLIDMLQRMFRASEKLRAEEAEELKAVRKPARQAQSKAMSKSKPASKSKVISESKTTTRKRAVKSRTT
jgi:DNA-binding MarR family transcriptional regulator